MSRDTFVWDNKELLNKYPKTLDVLLDLFFTESYFYGEDDFEIIPNTYDDLDEWFREEHKITPEQFYDTRNYFEELLKSVNYYTDDNREVYIELSDFPVLNQIDSGIDEIDLGYLVREYIENFENNTGVEVFTLGRSGRHVCVELNVDNLIRFNELKSEVDKLQKELINAANNYSTVEESFGYDTSVDDPEIYEIDASLNDDINFDKKTVNREELFNFVNKVADLYNDDAPENEILAISTFLGDYNIYIRVTESMSLNEDIDDDTVYAIASEIADLYKDYDFYDFIDCYDSDEEGIFEIASAIKDNNVDDIMIYLNYMIENENGELRDRAENLVSRLKSHLNIDECLTEDFDDEDEWIEVKSKNVYDTDGFMTDYTMYKNSDGTKYIFMFGDKDIYEPDEDYADWVCETEKEANDWFDSYGKEEDDFDEDWEDDDFDSYLEGEDDSQDWLDDPDISIFGFADEPLDEGIEAKFDDDQKIVIDRLTKNLVQYHYEIDGEKDGPYESKLIDGCEFYDEDGEHWDLHSDFGINVDFGKYGPDEEYVNSINSLEEDYDYFDNNEYDYFIIKDTIPFEGAYTFIDRPNGKIEDITYGELSDKTEKCKNLYNKDKRQNFMNKNGDYIGTKNYITLLTGKYSGTSKNIICYTNDRNEYETMRNEIIRKYVESSDLDESLTEDKDYGYYRSSLKSFGNYNLGGSIKTKDGRVGKIYRIDSNPYTDYGYFEIEFEDGEHEIFSEDQLKTEVILDESLQEDYKYAYPTDAREIADEIIKDVKDKFGDHFKVSTHIFYDGGNRERKGTISNWDLNRFIREINKLDSIWSYEKLYNYISFNGGIPTGNFKEYIISKSLNEKLNSSQYDEYITTKPISTYYVSGDLGIIIYNINYGIDDEVVWAWSNTPDELETSVIEYEYVDNEYDSRAFFMADDEKVYLDDCLRSFNESEHDEIDNKSLTENNDLDESYGGAYDIDENEYFTKEEIVDFAEAVKDEVEKDAINSPLTVTDVYTTNNNFGGDFLTIFIEDFEGNEHDYDVRIDMRKIKKPSDLYKYKDEFVNHFYNQFCLEEAELDESLNEADDYENIDESIKLNEDSKKPWGERAYNLNEIISSMNNEGAYYETGWLYIWPDGDTLDDACYDFETKEDYQELEDLFKQVYRKYHKDGLYTDSKRIEDMAHSWDEKLGLPTIENLYKELN